MKSIFLYEEVSLENYCTLNYEELPRINKYVDVTVSNMDLSKLKFVSGCVKYMEGKVKCHKFPLSQKILVLKDL